MQLLYKVSVGGQELKNRMVLAPLTRARYVALTYWWDARRDDGHRFIFLRCLTNLLNNVLDLWTKDALQVATLST
jgi:hypothetical protein